jgi:hypothetical protein
MKKLLIILVGTILCAQAADYALVTSHKTDIKEATSRILKDIYLQKRQFINGTKVIPVNILGSDKVRKVFEHKVLKMSKAKLNRYWIKKHFQGVKPPVTQASFNSIKSFVQNVNGSIGYLPKDMLDGKLKVLYEF